MARQRTARSEAPAAISALAPTVTKAPAAMSALAPTVTGKSSGSVTLEGPVDKSLRGPVGYRALLKTYIRYLTRHIGDHHIELLAQEPAPGLSRRDVAELRALLGEIRREDRNQGRELALDRAPQQGAPGAAPPRGAVPRPGGVVGR